MSSYSDFSRAASDIELERGTAAAEAARQNGQIWGGTLANLGSLVANAPIRHAQMQRLDQETQSGALDLQQKRQAIQANQILDTAYSKAFRPDGSLDESLIQQGLANTPAAHLWPDIHKKLMDAQKAGADLAELNGKVAAQERDHIAAVANAADTAPNPSDKAAALVVGLAGGVKAGALSRDHATSIIQQLLGEDGNPDPAKVTAQIARMKALSATDVEKRAQAASAQSLVAERAAELPGKLAQSQITQQVAAGTVNGITPEQQITNQNLAADNARQDAAAKETARHNKADEAIARAREGRESGDVKGDAKAIADAIASGEQPPSVTGLYRFAGPVRAELARQGYDFTKANLDWEATKKHLSTLNGAQQTRLRQAISTASDSLSVIEDLAKQWDGGKFPLLNKATLAAAKNGALGPKAQQIATNLTAQITDVTSELGNVYMGGNSPTDHALSLAQQNLSADWTRDQLLSAIKLARTNLQIRNNSIANSGAITTSGAQGGPAAPAVTPPAAAPGVPTYQDYLKSRGKK